MSWVTRSHRQRVTSCRLKLRPSFWWRRWWARCTLRSIPVPGTLRNRRRIMIPLSWYLILSAALFSIGLFGVLSRRNAVAILLGIELMLNSVNVNLAAFWRYGDVTNIAGQVFAVIVFAVAAAEVSVGLALVISVYRRRNTVIADELDLMKW